MMLVNYLNANFITLEELSSVTNIDQKEIRYYQTERLMPLASYNLNVALDCSSFTGTHNEKYVLEYYARGYISWLSIVHTLKCKGRVFEEFSNRYSKAISVLKGATCEVENSGLNETIMEDWEHFLQGTYGLCTKTGLPEDIAAKGFAVDQIKALLEREVLNSNEIKRLEYFVNLLDSASSSFAPHERLDSSRHRLVNEVRRKYKLQS
ncbi:DUF6058 family natural product biosynthesis protein [Vibrio ostreicida]|uniref:DUF6058 family natural product biosynthesis protein n=1 Tax=Vibrio ostreicida TaxID=526588 RepID=A0ABT8BZJ8_9VIBR|nr:DUF6058 family natural product biosynthesis protein [Vibrio ostreicida]MDN3612581.1 DUF6058 family natural product biosynthesis protein [Vibrio ostreicida]NPD09201.1 hypothetical protein [Vibrio ostreicida]